MIRLKWILLLLAGVIIVSGCVQQPAQDVSEQAKTKCVETCMMISSDLSNRSPCLSDNNLEWNISDWVCDVAHSPRISIDNLPENQCSEFREGKAHHFVEVNPSCEFIRAM